MSCNMLAGFTFELDLFCFEFHILSFRLESFYSDQVKWHAQCNQIVPQVKL